jgi:hypothetical protein
MRWKVAGPRWHLLFQSPAFSPPAQRQCTALSNSQGTEKTDADTQKQAAALHHFPPELD